MTRRFGLVLTFCGIVMAGSGLSAIFVRMETARVPVDRLVANVQAQVDADPRNVEKRINLARLYGMAYALKGADLPATSVGGVDQPWYGNAPSNIPYKAEQGALAADRVRAVGYLSRSIAEYDAALKLDPANLRARLGHAWSIDQKGEKPKAIDEYRKVVELGWAKEQQVKARDFESFITSEATQYLIPLLDPVKDAAEIKDLQQKYTQLESRPRAITPIAIPLGDCDTVTVDPAARVTFDADGSGLRRPWTWITPDSGWLVYDADGSGRITSALQWFGSVTFWLFWTNGYDALAALDNDRDGELRGPELNHLAIWRDANSNGVSDAGEVRPLSRYGIVSIATQHVAGNGVSLAAWSPRGVTFADGSSRPTFDVVLR